MKIMTKVEYKKGVNGTLKGAGIALPSLVAIFTIDLINKKK